MFNIDKEFIHFLVAIAIAIILVGSGITFLEKESCRANWSESGLKSKYNFIGGCRVEVEPGKWLPASSIRDTSITK